MSKLIKCKSCGADIAKSAKACPHCGAPNKKKGLVKSLIIIFVLFFILGSMGGNNGSDTSTGSPASSEATVQSKNEIAYEILSAKTTCWVNSIGTPWVQTIIEVKNTSDFNLYLSSSAYDLEDEAGSLISAKTMVSAYPQIIAPGEIGIIYDESTLDEYVDGNITVIPHEEVQKAKVDLVRFPVTDFELYEGKYGDIEMKGRVENTSDEDESMLYIAANLFDAEGSCIGQIFTIADVKAGEKKGFEQSSISFPDSVNLSDVASYEVFAFPFQMQF